VGRRVGNVVPHGLGDKDGGMDAGVLSEDKTVKLFTEVGRYRVAVTSKNNYVLWTPAWYRCRQLTLRE
jgi:hypothetical protein